MATDAKGLLRDRRAAIYQRLVDMTQPEHRGEAQGLIGELGDIERALEAIGAPLRNTKYGHHKHAIEAVVEYLSEVGRPASRLEIVRALKNGGFRAGAGKTDSAILKSISLFITGSGTAKDPDKSRKLKEINGLVGLLAWDDSLFRGPV